MTLLKANEIRNQLIQNPDCMAVVHDQKTGLELQFVHDIPADRICVLQSVNPDQVLIIPKDKRAQLVEMERDIIARSTASD